MDELDRESTRITSNGKGLIILLATLQGFLLYLLHYFIKHDYPLLQHDAWRVLCYSIILTAPLVIMLSIRHAKDKWPWIFAAALALLVGLTAFYTGYQCNDSVNIRCGESIFVPFTLSQTVALFIALFFFQTWLSSGNFSFPYSRLFNFSWFNFLTLALTVLFCLIFWSLLWLWAALFKLVGIYFFNELFFKTLWFEYIAGGFVFGIGIVIFRNEINFVYAVRKILRVLIWALLPLLAFIAILFLIVLPFTGIKPLWDTRHASFLMMWLMTLVLFFTNAVYQDGSGGRVYHRYAAIFIQAALVLIPVYVLLSAYSLYLRIQQHGWTHDRLWAVVILIFLSGYVFLYAWSVIKKRANWITLFRPVNTVMAVIIFLVCIITQTPLLDFRKITVHNQVSRLNAGEVDAKKFDYNYLRFDLGNPGYRALLALAENPLVIKAGMRPHIAELIARNNPSNRHILPEIGIANINLVPNDLVPPSRLLDLIYKDDISRRQCGGKISTCYLFSLDLNGDGAAEYVLLFAQYRRGWGFMYEFTGQTWEKTANINSPYISGNTLDEKQLKSGNIQAMDPVWKQLQIGKAVMNVLPFKGR